MAKVEEYAYDPLDGQEFPDYNARWDAEKAWMRDRNARNAELLDAGKVKGALISFPWADGRAYYLVTKERPLTVAAVYIGDAWSLPVMQVKGIDKEDVLSLLRQSVGRARTFGSIFDGS